MTLQPKIIKAHNTQNIKLSIQVRLNGLSFCTVNSENSEVVWYKTVDFSKEYNPVKIQEQIEELYKIEKQLQEPKDEVIVLFSNELYNLVPKEYFIEEEASNYLKFNTKILKTDIVAHDVLEKEELVNVYIPYTNITNYFFDKYGEFEFKHSVSVLIEAVLDLSHENKTAAYLNNFNGYYDLVVVKNNKLLLSNTFKYETREDFIYYLLFTAEQLNLDPSDFELFLLGNMDKDSPYYEIAYKYIENISFLEPNFQIAPGENGDAKFQREAYILLKSLACV